MPGFLKRFKIKSLSDGRFGRYVLYALGEVILVVVGILIALHINNKNEIRKEEKQFLSVLETIAVDLREDTTQIATAKKYYEARSKVALDILTGNYDDEALKKCFLCKNMLSTYLPVSLNEKGKVLLRNYNGASQVNDSLAVTISQFYIKLSPLVKKFGDETQDNTIATIKEWRNTKPWFQTTIMGNNDEAFNAYMTTQEYRNLVAYYNGIVLQNYLNILETYKNNATKLLIEIDKRTAQNAN